MPVSEQIPRLSFSHFIDRIFWLVITASALYVCTQMRDMSASISELNEKVAVVISQLANTERRLDKQATRMDRIEDTLFKRH